MFCSIRVELIDGKLRLPGEYSKRGNLGALNVNRALAMAERAIAIGEFGGTRINLEGDATTVT